MPKYHVCYPLGASVTVVVEADNKDEANEKAFEVASLIVDDLYKDAQALGVDLFDLDDSVYIEKQGA